MPTSLLIGSRLPNLDAINCSNPLVQVSVDLDQLLFLWVSGPVCLPLLEGWKREPHIQIIAQPGNGLWFMECFILDGSEGKTLGPVPEVKVLRQQKRIFLEYTIVVHEQVGAQMLVMNPSPRVHLGMSRNNDIHRIPEHVNQPHVLRQRQRGESMRFVHTATRVRFGLIHPV